jgi:hypothetical protein
MFLSEVPFDFIKPGLKVISPINSIGYVIKVGPYDREHQLIHIQWDHGAMSIQWHMWCNHITVADENTILRFMKLKVFL